MSKSRHLLVGLDWDEEEEGGVGGAGGEFLVVVVVVVEKRGVETGRCGKGGDVVADERDADEDGGAKDRGVVCCRRR